MQDSAELKETGSREKPLGSMEKKIPKESSSSSTPRSRVGIGFLACSRRRIELLSQSSWTTKRNCASRRECESKKQALPIFLQKSTILPAAVKLPNMMDPARENTDAICFTAEPSKRIGRFRGYMNYRPTEYTWWGRRDPLRIRSGACPFDIGYL